MAKKRAKKRAAAAAESKTPVSVQVVKAGTAAPGALVDVNSGLTGDNKFLITVRPKNGRPVLIAVHL